LEYIDDFVSKIFDKNTVLELNTVSMANHLAALMQDAHFEKELEALEVPHNAYEARMSEVKQLYTQVKNMLFSYTKAEFMIWIE
jgi:hypothetical protein